MEDMLFVMEKTPVYDIIISNKGKIMKFAILSTVLM